MRINISHQIKLILNLDFSAEIKKHWTQYVCDIDRGRIQTAAVDALRQPRMTTNKENSFVQHVLLAVYHRQSTERRG